MDRLLALSIDLDGLDLYRGLYDLDRDAAPLTAQQHELIPARAAERFGELCASLGVKGTLFVVGQDLARGHGEQALRALHDDGHEVASHSFSHDYALTRLDPARIDADLALAEQEIARVTGARPVGFRAPGYTLSSPLLELLRARGYLYDSSLLPSPAYFAAKAAVIGALTLTGRRSHSILGGVSRLADSRAPHVDSLLELPIATLPGSRLPFYGTLLGATPSAVTRVMAKLLAADELVVVELHGIDLCDASDGLPPALAARQRDLRIPARVKVDRIRAACRDLLQAGRRGLPLRDCARLVSAATRE